MVLQRNSGTAVKSSFNWKSISPGSTIEEIEENFTSLAGGEINE
ncbi:MAG TPA: hypothetical protein VIO64_09185 [Pseudobacteroides sp.]